MTEPGTEMSRTMGWYRRALVPVLVAASAVIAMPSSARAVAVTEFSLPAGSLPQAPTAGPDGNVWFVDSHAIGRITPTGAIKEFTLGLNPGSAPFDMTLGSDGNFWFTDLGTTKAIGKVTPAGVISESSTGLNAGAVPENVTLGDGGNVWFLDNGTTKAMGRITPAGTVNEFSTGLNPMSQPNALAPGPDGNIWFTDQGNTKAIGRVKPDGTINEFSSGLKGVMPFPNDITGGGDGNVYFSDDGSAEAIGRVKPDGTIDEFTDPIPGSQPDSLTLGPDGNVWFAEQNAAHRAIGRIKPDGTITEFDQGYTSGRLPGEITLGPDGNFWLPQSMGLPPLTAGVARVTIAGAITETAAGFNPGAGAEGDGMTVGPDGNMWFTDGGTTKAIGRVALQVPPAATTGAASGVTGSTATVAGSVNPLGAATTVTIEYGKTPALGSNVAAGSLPASGDASPVKATLTKLTSGTVSYYRVTATNPFGTTRGATSTFKTTGSPPKPPAPKPRVTTTHFGNQRITLTTPSASSCIAKTKTKTLGVTLASSAVKKSRATKLHFSGAAFYLDRGVKHHRKKTIRKHGKKRTVTVTVYTANAAAKHVPARLKLRLKALKKGAHTLKVVTTYTKTVTSHHRKHKVHVTRTLRVKFRVC